MENQKLVQYLHYVDYFEHSSCDISFEKVSIKGTM